MNPRLKMSHDGVWEIGGKMEVERWGDGRRIAADTSAGRYTLWLQDACCRDVDLRVDTHHHRIHGRALRRHLSPSHWEGNRGQPTAAAVRSSVTRSSRDCTRSAPPGCCTAPWGSAAMRAAAPRRGGRQRCGLLHRAVRLVLVIWVVAGVCSLPIVVQYGVVYVQV